MELTMNFPIESFRDRTWSLSSIEALQKKLVAVELTTSNLELSINPRVMQTCATSAASAERGP